MASEYCRIDTVLDGDGDLAEIGFCRDRVVITIPRPDGAPLDAAQREQFIRAFMAAERAAETYDPAHPF